MSEPVTPQTQAGRELLAQINGPNPWRLGDNAMAMSAFIFAIEQEAIAAYERVDRFEVIDHRVDGKGRVFVAWPCDIELSYQDDGRTLKVLVNAETDAAAIRAKNDE